MSPRKKILLTIFILGLILVSLGIGMLLERRLGLIQRIPDVPKIKDTFAIRIP